jgi:hypothetical protein
MRPPKSLIALTLAWLFTSGSVSYGAGIVINEYTNTNGNVTAGYKFTSNEYVEFVLTGDMTVSQLGALTFGDSNATTSTLNSSFKFNTSTLTTALGSNTVFRAGTIIVVGGNDFTENLTYNPLAGNITDDDAWGIRLTVSPISGPSTGVLNNNIAGMNGNFEIANQGDVVWVASGNPANNTDTSGFVHAIGHDNDPGLIGNAANALEPSTIGSPKSVYNTAGAVISLTNSGDSTMGTGNTAANTAWIQSLRGAVFVPEPSRLLLLFFGALGLVSRRQRNS